MKVNWLAAATLAVAAWTGLPQAAHAQSGTFTVSDLEVEPAASSTFEVPALVGLPGRISVLTTDIYTNMVARAPPDIGGASALSVLMLLLVFRPYGLFGVAEAKRV